MSLFVDEKDPQDMLGSSFGFGSRSAPTYYEILGVDPIDSKVKIREVYIRLKKAYSSSSQALYSLMDEQSAKQTLTQIEEAFYTLDNDELRRKYDEKLRLGSSAASAGEFTGRRGGRGASVSPVSRDDAGAAVEEGYESNGFIATLTQEAAEPQVKQYPKLRRATDMVRDSVSTSQIAELSARCQEGDGSFYRQIRETMGISLEDAHSQTRVIVKYLVAIEENDYSALPAPVYVRGFIRSYLLFLGVNHLDSCVNRYLEKYINWTRKSAK
jgi:DnaJ-class molecular chaperone